MVKTTIDVPDELWKKFSITVMDKIGGRKKNDIILEMIEEYVYTYNGVVCRHCFKDINLTDIQPKGGVRDTTFWERMMGVTGFKATCPHCKKELIYHMDDVRPIRRVIS